MRGYEMQVTAIKHCSIMNNAYRSALIGGAICFSLASTARAEGTAGSDVQLEEVVITGYRASLQSALDAKRKSNQAIESIAAEDIGKMPDQNVAESLQRLPGLQINRAGGKGTQVLIDGLSNNLITLNGDVFLTGKEFYVSGEASGGGNGSNVQYASLEGIPSEEIGGIDVIKNPTAANREGGLGGIVDLKTRSALAQPMGLSIGGNVRGTKSTDAEGGMTPNVTLVGGFKFSDRFAITASVSYDDQKTHDKQYQAQNRNQWLITNAAQVGSYVGSPAAGTLSTLPGGQLYIEPQFAYFSDVLQQVKTKGATLGLEWKWTDEITSSLNYFYVHEEDESTTYSNKTWFNGQGAAPGSLMPGIDPSKPYSIDGNGVVQSAAFMANGAETATLYQNTTSKANNVQFNTVFAGDGAWTGDAGLSYAKATSDLQAAQADVEHGGYTAFNGTSFIAPTAPGCNNGGSSCTNGNHGYTFNWNNGGNSGLPSVSYPNAFGVTDVLSNPAYAVFKSNWAWANMTDEKNLAVKGNLHFVHSIGVRSTILLIYDGLF
jgi:TonB-dependent receptor